jgi:flagellar L-ring protein precursor FlgH
VRNPFRSRLLIMVVAGSMAGCARAPLMPSPAFAPVIPQASASAPASSGSIFIDGRGDNLFGRQRDYRVGDVITVLLNEQTQASRLQHTTLARSSSNNAFPSVQAGLTSALKGSIPGLSSFFGQVKPDGSTIKSDGQGDSGQQASLVGAIAVSVIDVMANGNLVVRGEKQLALSEGSEVIQVSGVVRAEDIAPNGTVTSRRLANAQIAYRGYGDGADAARPGWGTRVLNAVWPF